MYELKDQQACTSVRVLGAITALAMLLAGTTIRAESTPKPVHSVEGVFEYGFDNGLKLLLIPDQSIATLTVNVVVRAGSRHESYGETGAAHLLEHLQFKGTARYPEKAATAQKYGWTGYATTWYDYTNFIHTMEGTEENLEEILRYEADRLTNSLLLPLHLEQEMTVVRNELENSENNPLGLLPPRMRANSLEWHNYGKGTIGNLADLENMPIERIRNFYKRNYQPDNVTLILAGRFDTGQALSAVKRYWASIPRPTRLLSDDYTLEPAQDGERLVTVRRAGGVPMVGVHYHIPAAAHPDFAAVHVLASWLMGVSPAQLWQLRAANPRGHLHKSLVADSEFTSVLGSISGLSQRGFLELYAPCKTAHATTAALDRMIRVVETSEEADLEERDVRTARNRLLREMRATTMDLTKFAVELTYWEANGDWRLFFLHRDRLERIELADVRRVATKYLTQSNRVAGIYLPETARSRVDIPRPPDVAQLLDDYENNRPALAGEYIEPTPSAIEQRTARRQTNSGTRLILLPKRTRGDRIVMRLLLPYGNVQSLSSRRVAASLLAKMITSEEARRKAREGIRGSLAGFSVSAAGQPGRLEIRIRSDHEYLERGWPMLTKLLRQPYFSQRDFERLRQSEIASVRMAMDIPSALAERAVLRAGQSYDRNDPRYVPTFDEELQQLRSVGMEDVQTIWQECVGASRGVFVAIGEFDTDALADRVDQLTHDWKAATPYEPLPLLKPGAPARSPIVVNIPDKSSIAFAADLYIDVDEQHEDYAALLVAQEILRTSQFLQRVSRDQGLSHVPRFHFRSLQHSNMSRLEIRVHCNPRRQAELEEAIRDTFRSIHDSPFSQFEFERAKTTLEHMDKIRLWSDQNLLTTLTAVGAKGATLDQFYELRDRIESLDLATVQRAAETHLDYDEMIVAISGDVTTDAVRAN